MVCVTVRFQSRSGHIVTTLNVTLTNEIQLPGKPNEVGREAEINGSDRVPFPPDLMFSPRMFDLSVLARQRGKLADCEGRGRAP